MKTVVLVTGSAPGSVAVTHATLAGREFDLITAPTGTAALGQMAAIAPAVVVIAGTLPDWEASDLCRRIKRSDHRPPPFVIQIEAADAGGGGASADTDFLLHEPYAPEELRVAVTTLARLHRRETQRSQAPAPGALIDVTERVDAAAERSMLAAIVEATSDLVARAEPDGTITYINQAGRRLLGIGPDEDLTQIKIADCHPAWAYAIVTAEGIPSALRNGVWQGDTALRHRDGREIQVSQVILAGSDAQRPFFWLATDVRDISEQRRGQAILNRQLREIEAIYDTAPVGLCMLDREFRYRRINRQLAELNGFPVEAHLGRTIRDMVPMLADFSELLVRRVLETGQPVSNFEFGGETAARPGVLRYWKTHWTPLRDQNGVFAVNVVVEETTERKRLEELMRQREREFATLAENLPYALARLDRNLRHLYVNRTVTRFTGRDKEQFIGRRIREILGDDNVHCDFFESQCREVFTDGQERRFEFESQGRCYSCRLVAECQLDGTTATLLAITEDVTEQQRTLESLRCSEQLTMATLNALPAQITVIDEDGTVLMANTAWSAYAAVSGNPDAGRIARDANYFEVYGQSQDPEIGQVLAGIRAVLDGRLPLFSREYPCDTPNRKYWFLLQVVPLDGPPRGAVIAHIDITERKIAEAALQEADRRKDEFLAMLAHELRNPLAPIRNSVRLLKEPAPSETTIEWIRDIIERQVSHLTRLVDDLLDVSRLVMGKITLQVSRVAVCDLFDCALEMVRPLIVARRHELVVSPPADPLFVDGDAARLIEVMENLLTNAAKYTAEGGTIWLLAGREDGQIVIRVRDTGVGIAPDLLPHVFELFTQGERTPDRSQGGLGIGLTIVRKLVELHGGWVDVTSEGVGRGSEFVVGLPPSTQPGGNEPPAPGTSPAAKGVRSRRILVVDDNSDALESLAVLLELDGHDVKSALDGPTALDLASVFQPEVVLLDIGLPDMDGYEVARRLRARPEGRNVLLVAVTGYGQREARAATLDAGFDLHLVKPVDPAELAKVLAAEPPDRPGM